MNRNNIEKICNKYCIGNLYKNFLRENDTRMKIGFLGESSSGKSSVIDSLVEENLISLNASKTKAIVEIRFGDVGFFKVKNYRKVAINKETFDFLRINNKDYKPIPYLLAITPLFNDLNFTGMRNTDFVFIDTPGLSSIYGFDLNLTFQCLREFKYIVICHDITQKSLGNSTIEFIIKNKHLQHNFIFCITKSDLMPFDSIEKIRKNIIKQIQSIPLNIKDMDKKVIITSKYKENLELKELIISEFYSDFKDLKDKKIDRIQKEYSIKLIKILEDRYVYLKFSVDNLNWMIDFTDREVQTLKKSIKNQDCNIKYMLDSMHSMINCISIQSLRSLSVNDESIFYGEIIDFIQNTTSKFFNKSINSNDASKIKFIQEIVNSAKNQIGTISVFNRLLKSMSLRIKYDTLSFKNYETNVVINSTNDNLGYVTSSFLKVFCNISLEDAIKIISSVIKKTIYINIKHIAEEEFMVHIKNDIGYRKDSLLWALGIKKNNTIKDIAKIRQDLISDIKSLQSQYNKN